jgi:predicted XRE-type DNA-binding protein
VKAAVFQDLDLGKRRLRKIRMKKTKMVVTRSAGELAKALGLTPADGAEIALRSELNSKIAKIVQHKKLTHAQVARLAGTSRTRVTAILNRNTQDVSTDLLLRVLYALGYTAKITFQKAVWDGVDTQESSGHVRGVRSRHWRLR